MKTFADISLVIPTYDGDIEFLPQLLSLIYSFTVLPKQIVVVASGIVNLEAYLGNFSGQSQPELIRCQVSKRINQARARNIGAKMASSKLLMFHDVDDIPHPQKFQITEMIFEKDHSVDYVVHGYSTGENVSRHDYLRDGLRLDYALVPHPTTMGLACASGMAIHNSHITFHKKIFDKFALSFDETNKAIRQEDSLLTQKIHALGLQGVMACGELVQYRPSSARK